MAKAAKLSAAQKDDARLVKLQARVQKRAERARIQREIAERKDALRKLRLKA